MNCLKCGAELELVENLGGDGVFRLRYGKKDEEAGICPNGCSGLFTETSLRRTASLRERLKKRQLLRQEL